MLSDSNTNVNSMINRRVSLFYRYPLKVFHHMVCPCTLDGVCVVCPGTSELVGQQAMIYIQCNCLFVLYNVILYVNCNAIGI